MFVLIVVMQLKSEMSTSLSSCPRPRTQLGEKKRYETKGDEEDDGGGKLGFPSLRNISIRCGGMRWTEWRRREKCTNFGTTFLSTTVIASSERIAYIITAIQDTSLPLAAGRENCIRSAQYCANKIAQRRFYWIFFGFAGMRRDGLISLFLTG